MMVDDDGQCHAVFYQQGFRARCHRIAAKDGLCGPHRAGRKRSAQRAAAESARWLEVQSVSAHVVADFIASGLPGKVSVGLDGADVALVLTLPEYRELIQLATRLTPGGLDDSR